MEFKEITKISEIEFLEMQETGYTFKASVQSIDFIGDKEKRRPLTITVKLPSTDLAKLVTWSYDSLSLFEQAIADKTILIFKCKSKSQNGRDNLIMHSCELTEEIEKETSADKKAKKSISDYYRKEINKLINKEITNPLFKKLLDDLLTDDFYKWRAAKSIHHNFEGGLAMHSYNVALSALGMCKPYEQFKMINKELVITGALLHDIGKMVEYADSGNYSLEGQLLSHIPLGIHMILDRVNQLDWTDADSLIVDDEKKNNLVLQLVHIIASHHGKLEYGSPNLPSIPEAIIVSHADCMDSEMEAARTALLATNIHAASTRVFSLGTSLVKFDKESGE